MKRKILLAIGIFLIIFGIIILLYPIVSDYLYQKNVEKDLEIFNIKNSKNEEDDENTESENLLENLYKELQYRNIQLYETNQNNLVDPFSYEQASVNLEEYGIEDNIIGYIIIPKMDIKLPILLGANSSNMKKGAVHLTETSYPIGGVNTNSVIAAHRGYGQARMFRNIDKLEYGDTIYIQNFREELIYKVYEIKLVSPNAVEELKIQEGKDIITLITCHPYRVNTQRYIVRAERV